MGEAVARFIGRQVSLGVSPERSVRQNSYARRANVMGLCFFVASLPYGPLFLYWGYPVLGWLTSLAIGLYLLPLWLNRLQWFTAARVSLPLALTAIVAMISLWFGRDGQAHLALFIVLCCPFQLFDVRKEWKPLGLPLLTCTLLFMAVQVDALPTEMRQSVPESVKTGLRASFGVGIMVVFALILGYFYSQNQDNERALQESVEELTFAMQEQLRSKSLLKQARDEARRASDSKGQFLAMVSHELCTPLNGILGSIGELQPILRDSESIDLVQMMRTSGDRLASLLQGLVDFVSLDSEKGNLREEDIDAVELLEGVLAEYASKAHSKQLTLDGHIEDNISRLLTGDPRRIRQVVGNILDNAIRYTSSGAVLVTASLTESEGQALLSIAVSDTGPGMSLDLTKRIFQPFEQAVDIKHRQAEGLGLGLAFCRKLVSAMQGDISITAGEQQGTTVRATLRVGLSDALSRKHPAIAGQAVFLDVHDSVCRKSLELILKRGGAQFAATRELA